MRFRQFLLRSLVLATLAACNKASAKNDPTGTSGSTDPGCTKDSDCKGDRICTQGQCGPPPITSTPACPPCAACPDCASTASAPDANPSGSAVSGSKPLSDVARAKALLLEHPDQAKLILYNRLSSRQGTPEEYRVLLAACRASPDQACIEQCKRKLGER